MLRDQCEPSVKRITVKALASEAGLDNDEALILLWDAGFQYINGPGDFLARGEANRARRALGLATRRELASPSYWARLFGVSDDALAPLLATLGVVKPFAGGQLTKKAQHRLTGAAKERGLLGASLEVAVVPSQETDSTLEWVVIGHERDCQGPTAEQVLAIHEELVADFAQSKDPITPSGLKSAPMLESAVHRPETSSGDTRKYPTVEMGAAALLHSLVHNHPFHNGNKRTALVAMIVFIDANGFVLTADEDELFKMVLQLAQHALVARDRTELADREVLEVSRWLRLRVRRKEKGDRPVQWRDLRHLLVARGCECEQAPRGQRMAISRVVERGKSWLGRTRKERLSFTFTNVQDGRDIDINTVRNMRRELELDEEHGVDSAAFYADAELSTSDFIRSYQGILRRLANV